MTGPARLRCAAILALVALSACGGSPAGSAASVAAITTPTPLPTPTVPITPPPPPPPSPTASPSPAAGITITVDPSTPVLGAQFDLVVAGLTAGEVVTILVLPVGFSTNEPPRTVTADAGGIARQTNIFTNASFQNFFARVTRADGRRAELQFPIAAVAAPGASAGASKCDPGTGPSGTRFFCIFYGFPPNATGHLCFARVGSPSPLDSCSDLPIQPNGTFPVGTHDPTPPGTYTYTLTVGAQTQSLSITVTP